VIVIVIAGSFGASAALTKSESPPRPSGIYNVIESGLTLRGGAALVPCSDSELTSCPSSENASLPNVYLIQYGSTLYYLNNQTSVGRTVWFTNSTVFCISPPLPLTNTAHQVPTCPTEPYGSSSIVIPIQSVSTQNISSGILFSLILSTNSGQALQVSVTVLNTRSSENNVTAADHWPAGEFFSWIGGDECGTSGFLPMGYEVLQGDYGYDNFTSATPLYLEVLPELPLLCPAEIPTPYYSFMPNSDVAQEKAGGLGGSGVHGLPFDTSCQWTQSLPCWWWGVGPWFGYWTGSGDTVEGGPCPAQTSSTGTSGCPLDFTPFPPGTYTVVAADEWGQVLVDHFEVVANPSAAPS